MLDELEEIRTAAELKDFMKDFPKPKAALTDLVNAAKRAKGNLSRVLVEREKEQMKKKAAA